jgi:hypothetical protein
MSSIQQIGERIKEQLQASGANYHSTVALFGGEIIERIDGVRFVQKQLRSEIPRREDRLIAMRNELAALEGKG